MDGNYLIKVEFAPLNGAVVIIDKNKMVIGRHIAVPDDFEFHFPVRREVSPEEKLTRILNLLSRVTFEEESECIIGSACR